MQFHLKTYYFCFIALCIQCFSVTHAKTVIIGFDGMDPNLLSQWMSAGDLPHFKELSKKGHFQPLATTYPAQSPVAWSTFATGLNPGEHGIFDFVHRNPSDYSSEYAISGIKPGPSWNILGLEVPVGNPIIFNRRAGKPFWLSAEQMGASASILRVPASYPPDPIYRMLSGMGIPDLLGTQGTYTFYTTGYVNPTEIGGRLVRIDRHQSHIDTFIEGPQHPFGSSALTIPMVLEAHTADSVKVRVDDHAIQLTEKQWSDWVPLSFSYAGVFSMEGMVRMYLVEAFPRVKLYLSPIHLNPTEPLVPISHPNNFAADLATDMGLFHTLGMPEETWSLNDGLISDDAYLDMVKDILAEREKMFFQQLQDPNNDLVVSVFVQTDRVSHMFWRGLDPRHALHETTSERGKQAIHWIYQEADRILGKTMDQLAAEDRLIVLSDHGFAPYYRQVNLNQWLLQQGYLVLKSGQNKGSFDAQDIDWSKTSAYAMGLNGIYINTRHRERKGFIEPQAVEQLKKEISNKLATLSDQKNAEPVITQTHNNKQLYSGVNIDTSPDLVIGYARGYRASWQTVLGSSGDEILADNLEKWSGDHCIDSQHVPGILLTNFTIDNPVSGLDAIGTLANSLLLVSPLPDIIYYEAGLADPLRSAFQKFNTLTDRFMPSWLVLMFHGLWFGVAILLFNKYIQSSQKRTIAHVARLLIFSCLMFIFSWASISETYRYVKQVQSDTLATIEAIATPAAELSSLKWFNSTTSQEDDTLQLIGHNKWQFTQEKISEKLSLRNIDQLEIMQLDNDSTSGPRLKRWWHSLLSHPQGYLPNNSQIERIDIETDPDNILLAWYLLGVFIVDLFEKARRRTIANS
ncbi:alkaline phosphatase family protein [Marinicella sp. W31]|uniref:alkaline phosphatase family protein n=1 Tax=Marinicella sp. W31 TaxID=3023713 RepID=UPI00375776A6